MPGLQAYSGAASFVPALTTKVVQYLDPQPQDDILDIGCGDGVLTANIAARCHYITGLDNSKSMIQTAKEQVQTKHPNSDFIIADCRRVSPDACETESLDILKAMQEDRWDKVFSNAAMHWILRDQGNRFDFFDDVFWLLKPGGKFVFEMGGHGNVSEAHAAITAVLNLKYGVPMERIRSGDPWFFPSVDWMRKTLSDAGFSVEIVESEYRPTKLTAHAEDGSGGIEGWIRLMGASFFDLVDSQSDRDGAVALVCDILKDATTRTEDDSQWLGYVRLRAVARKPT